MQWFDAFTINSGYIHVNYSVTSWYFYCVRSWSRELDWCGKSNGDKVLKKVFFCAIKWERFWFHFSCWHYVQRVLCWPLMIGGSMATFTRFIHGHFKIVTIMESETYMELQWDCHTSNTSVWLECGCPQYTSHQWSISATTYRILRIYTNNSEQWTISIVWLHVVKSWISN